MNTLSQRTLTFLIKDNQVLLGFKKTGFGQGNYLVVGNIGSTKRSKNGVIGQPVNLTARIESFTVGGQVLVSPTLITAMNHELILGEEVKVHGKGMQKALRCRELLGHENHPELLIKEEEPIFTNLDDPLPFYYSVLTDKHHDGQMQLATLVSISQRRAVVEVAGQLPRRSNIMFRLEGRSGEEGSPELYAKVIHPLDELGKRYLLHFTWVPPDMQMRLQRLTEGAKVPAAAAVPAAKNDANRTG